MNTNSSSITWKPFLILVIKTFSAFYLATICLALEFVYFSPGFTLETISMVTLYVFVLIACALRVIRELPVAALMLAIPIVPLLVLISVLSLIPLLQFLLH